MFLNYKLIISLCYVNFITGKNSKGSIHQGICVTQDKEGEGIS